MMKFAWSLVVALLVSTVAHAQSVEWTLDTNHTNIGFTARHLGFTKVHGEFKTFSAKIEADAKTAKITKLEAEADTKSVNTDVEKRDEDLRSEHFFYASKFPKLKLVLKSIQWNGNKFTATCALTMRDVTKDVKFEGELLGVQTVDFGRGPHQRAAYEAKATVNRKEFGLNFNGLAEGVAIVSDNVDIELEVEMSAPIAK
jgi:polyisoprenoid-binding protein YceI